MGQCKKMCKVHFVLFLVAQLQFLYFRILLKLSPPPKKLKISYTERDSDMSKVECCIIRSVALRHRRRMETESKAKCRRFGMGGKIECRTRNFWCECVANVYI